jgi:hypothetical protein
MTLSEVTVKVHRDKLMEKLGAKSLPELVRMANVLGVAPRWRQCRSQFAALNMPVSQSRTAPQ